jgi:hypothetical protein
MGTTLALIAAPSQRAGRRPSRRPAKLDSPVGCNERSELHRPPTDASSHRPSCGRHHCQIHHRLRRLFLLRSQVLSALETCRLTSPETARKTRPHSIPGKAPASPQAQPANQQQTRTAIKRHPVRPFDACPVPHCSARATAPRAPFAVVARVPPTRGSAIRAMTRSRANSRDL